MVLGCQQHNELVRLIWSDLKGLGRYFFYGDEMAQDLSGLRYLTKIPFIPPVSSCVLPSLRR